MTKKILACFGAVVAGFVMSVSFATPAYAQEAPQVSTFVSSVSVRVDNVKYQDLYDFVTDIRNDQLWYPGILNTTVLQTGKNGKKVGTRYHQIATVDGVLTTNTYIDVLAAKKNKYYLIHGDGDIADYDALYTFEKAGNGGGVFTLTSRYTVPGLTEEQFAGYIQYALGGLLRYYNSPGAVTINYLYTE
jgi:hypothetical protein